jgi:hypothetical protein
MRAGRAVSGSPFGDEETAEVGPVEEGLGFADPTAQRTGLEELVKRDIVVMSCVSGATR